MSCLEACNEAEMSEAAVRRAMRRPCECPCGCVRGQGDEVGHVFDPFRANEAEFHHITPLSRREACLTQCAVVSVGVAGKEAFCW